MKALVIGSKGFIGQNVLTHFQQKGYEVWGADVIVDYVHNEQYFLMDASNADFNNIFEQQNFDLCINCSGAASVPESLKNPLRDYFLNTVNVFKILEAIKKYQPGCKFMNLSSAAVYGNPKQLPVKESAFTNPLSPYGIHKLQAEQICKEFNEFFNLKTCCIRIFSVYGNGLRKQLFWDLYKKAQSNQTFKLFGTGNESRDFIHVLDLVNAIELVYKNAEFNAEAINVANGNEILIKDAVSTFYSFFSSKISYSFSGDIREGDPVNWKADISKLTQFGYKPDIDLKAGLESYYTWIKNNND